MWKTRVSHNCNLFCRNFILLPLSSTSKMEDRYANEVGESFRKIVPEKVVLATYALSIGYILADTGDKTIKMHNEEMKKPTYNTSRVAVSALDTAIWQSLASVAIPGFTINRTCAAVFHAVTKYTKLALSKRKFITTTVGLSLIPFIVKPIDKLVDYVMDKTLRPLYGKE